MCLNLRRLCGFLLLVMMMTPKGVASTTPTPTVSWEEFVSECHSAETLGKTCGSAFLKGVQPPANGDIYKDIADINKLYAEAGGSTFSYPPSGPLPLSPIEPYVSAVTWDGYQTAQSTETSNRFTQKYPAYFMKGFVTFDSQTCATWDVPTRHKHEASNFDKSPKSAEDCVHELDKPQNYMYYGVTYVSVVHDSGARISQPDPSDPNKKHWDWKVSPTRTHDYQSRGVFTSTVTKCYFITRRCVELLAVEITSTDIEFNHYSPPWQSKLTQKHPMPMNRPSKGHSHVSVVTFLRQRPFTGIPHSMPYARANNRATEEHMVDNGFSLPNMRTTLPGFSATPMGSTHDNFDVLKVHDVSDPRQRVGESVFDVEYSLVRRGHRCGDTWTSGASIFTRTVIMDALLQDKGLAGTPLECAKACMGSGGGWFLRGALTQQCQCYKSTTMSKCLPVASPGTDLFEFGTTVPKTEYNLVKAGALCMGIGSRSATATGQQLRYYAGTHASLSSCSGACRDHSQFFAYDTISKHCVCDVPQQGDAGCTTYKTSGSAKVSALPEVSIITTSVTASTFSLYRYKGDEFHLKGLDECCVDPHRPANVNCNDIKSQQNTGDLSWLEMSAASTLVGCSKACHGVSNWFIYKMYGSVASNDAFSGNPTCFCLLNRQRHLHNNNSDYTRTPNYVLSNDGVNVDEKSGEYWTLEMCKKTCDSTPDCAVRGFSWMHVNGQNNCRLSTKSAAVVHYLDPATMTTIPHSIKALAGFYRVGTQANFQCKHKPTFFSSGVRSDTKLNQYRLYSFDMQPRLLQRDSVCSTAIGSGATHATIQDKVETLLECGAVCQMKEKTQWFAYGRERAPDGSVTGTCTATNKLTQQIGHCACQCQKIKLGFDCSRRTARYGMDLYFYHGTLEAPRTLAHHDLLALDPSRVDFAQLKCAWTKVTQGTTCYKKMFNGGGSNRKYANYSPISTSLSKYRSDCVKSELCTGYTSFVDYRVGSSATRLSIFRCDTTVFVQQTLPDPDFTSLTSASYHEYTPSACSCAWDTIPGHSCKQMAIPGGNTPFYASSIEEASRKCVSLRDTECKYGFSHSTSKDGGKYKVYFAHNGRCDGPGGSMNASDSIYVRFTPEECLSSTRPSVSHLEDVYTTKFTESESDHTKLPCAWTVHRNKMCMDPRAYRWAPQDTQAYIKATEAGAKTVYGDNAFLEFGKNWNGGWPAMRWGGSSNCQVLDTLRTSPLRTEGMIKYVSQSSSSYTAQTGNDATGFNYFINGSLRTSFALHPSDWAQHGFFNGKPIIPLTERACNTATQQRQYEFKKDGNVYKWEYPQGYEKGWRELYQWNNFVASKSNRQCVMVKVKDGMYYEHHPWKCKPCSNSNNNKASSSCRRQVLYGRNEVPPRKLSVVSNWLNTCREHCRSDGPACNAFVIDEAFGSYKCITLRLSSSTNNTVTGSGRYDPLLKDVVLQRYWKDDTPSKENAKINRKNPSWQIQRGRVLPSSNTVEKTLASHLSSDQYAIDDIYEYADISLEECRKKCNVNSCHKHGFSFIASDNDPTKGECRIPVLRNTNDYSPYDSKADVAHVPSTKGALYYRTAIAWNRLENAQCVGNYKTQTLKNRPEFAITEPIPAPPDKVKGAWSTAYTSEAVKKEVKAWTDKQCQMHKGSAWRGMSTVDAMNYQWYGDGETERFWRTGQNYWSANAALPNKGSWQGRANPLINYGTDHRTVVCIRFHYVAESAELAYAPAQAPTNWQQYGDGGAAWAMWADERCRDTQGSEWKSMSKDDANHYKLYGEWGTRLNSRWWRGERTYWREDDTFDSGGANKIEVDQGVREVVCIRPIYNTPLTLQQCKARCEYSVHDDQQWDMCKRFGFSFKITDSASGTGECRIPNPSSVRNQNLFGATYNPPISYKGINIEGTDTYYHYDATQDTSNCDADKKCLRNQEPFRPCDSEYSMGSTLYYPQTGLEPPTVLTLHPESSYTFSEVTNTRCLTFGRAINGIVTSPVASETASRNDDDARTFITSIDASINLEKCKRMCMGTPGCIEHGFSFSSSGWSPQTGGVTYSGGFLGPGILDKYVLDGSTYDELPLHLHDCYVKCQSIQGCIEVGFSWHRTFVSTVFHSTNIQTYHCRIPKDPKFTSSYSLKSEPGRAPDSTQSIKGLANAAFYKANTCFLPHFDAQSPCKRASDPSGLSTFYTITPKDAAKTPVKPHMNAAQLLDWTHSYSGIRNLVYYADKAYSTSPAYAPDLNVSLDHAPSNSQIGAKVTPAFDWSEAVDIPTSYVGNDQLQDLVASFCRYRCAMAISCVSFKVDVASLASGCWLYGPSTIVTPINMTGAPLYPSGFLGISYSMIRAYEEQAIITVKGTMDMLGIEYGDLLSPVLHSYKNVQLCEHVVNTGTDGQPYVYTNQGQQCDGSKCHHIPDITLERCKEIRIGYVENKLLSWTKIDDLKTQFSYREATQTTGSMCFIPKEGQDCIHTPADVGWKLYKVDNNNVVQLYSKNINPWMFKQITTLKDCALQCLALYMQGCRVLTYSPSRTTSGITQPICYLFPLDEPHHDSTLTSTSTSTATSGGASKMSFCYSNTAATIEPTDFKGIAVNNHVASPSYYVTHPSMYMKVDIGMYEYVKDFGVQYRCAANGSPHVISGATRIAVSASNALVECANKCSRANEEFTGGSAAATNNYVQQGNQMVFGCSAFSIEAPMYCTLYTRCDDSTRVPARAVTWNYRIRQSHGPFLYSGTPSQRCVTEYEDLAFGAAAAKGPIYKDTAVNPLQQCMELCAAHHARAAREKLQHKGCGGFSMSDSGECRLHGPCKLTPDAKTANGYGITKIVSDRTLENSFRFHGGFSPVGNHRNRVVREHPVVSPAYLHNDAWGRAVDTFCTLEYGPGWRAATTAEGKAYAQYGSSRLYRRWKDGFGRFEQGQWISSVAAQSSSSIPTCTRFNDDMSQMHCIPLSQLEPTKMQGTLLIGGYRSGVSQGLTQEKYALKACADECLNDANCRIKGFSLTKFVTTTVNIPYECRLSTSTTQIFVYPANPQGHLFTYTTEPHRSQGAFYPMHYIAAPSASSNDNYPVCFRPPVPRRYYQFPTSFSIYTRIPQLNYACSGTPLLRHNGIIGDDGASSPNDSRGGARNLLRSCADLCTVNMQGMKDVHGPGLPARNSGCVGFTVSTAGHCDLYVTCNARSVRYVEPEMNLMRVSYSMEAANVVVAAGGSDK